MPAATPFSSGRCCDTTGANITKAVFSLTAGTNVNVESNYLGDFALDTLSLNSPVSGTPEPPTFFLLSGALIGLQWVVRRMVPRKKIIQ